MKMDLPFQLVRNLSLIFLTIALAGCVSNSRNNDYSPNAEAKKYPRQADEIRSNYRKFEPQMQTNSNNFIGYMVNQEKVGGWVIAGSNADLGIGSNRYNYHHSIRLKLVCGADQFVPKVYRSKNVKWNLDNFIEGENQTSQSGVLQINLKTDAENRFEKIHLKIGEKQIALELRDEIPPVEIGKDECE